MEMVLVKMMCLIIHADATKVIQDVTVRQRSMSVTIILVNMEALA